MSKTPFTAAQVREEAAFVRGVASWMRTPDDAEHWAAMLDAFAQRLEQEENPAIGYTKAYMRADVAAYIASLREEGRREVLREVGEKLETPIDDFNVCMFCKSYNEYPKDDTHTPDCLWLRAQEAVTP